MKPYVVVSFVLLLISLVVVPYKVHGADVRGRWYGQTIYVPVYSHIYADERYKDVPFLLSVTLSIRNADSAKPLTVQSINYHDSQGVLLKQYLVTPLTIVPLGSAQYIVPESESQGGAGAKFLVVWEAADAVIEPIVEAVMIGTKLQQGISFLSTGRVIHGASIR